MLLASSFPQNGISSSENFFLSTPFFLFFFSFKSYEIIFISVARFLLSSKWNILVEEFSFQSYIYIYSFSPSFINFLPIQGGRKLLFLKFLRQRRNLFSSIPNPILSLPSSPSVQPTLSLPLSLTFLPRPRTQIQSAILQKLKTGCQTSVEIALRLDSVLPPPM